MGVLENSILQASFLFYNPKIKQKKSHMGLFKTQYQNLLTNVINISFSVHSEHHQEVQFLL